MLNVLKTVFIQHATAVIFHTNVWWPVSWFLLHKTRLCGWLLAGLVTLKQSSNNNSIAIFKRLAAELFCGGHDNGNIKVWMELIHSRLHTKAVALVQRAVQVHTNQEKMEDDDLSGRSHSGSQRYEDNYAPIKHRKRCRKTSLKFSKQVSASTTGGNFQWFCLTERF